MVFIFILNSAIFLRLSADVPPNSAAECNFLCIVPPEPSPSCASAVGGIGGVIIEGFNNAGGTSAVYSHTVGDCSNPGVPRTTSEMFNYYQSVAQERFSWNNSVASVNKEILAQRPASAIIYAQDRIYALTNFNTVSAQSADYAYYSPGGTGFNLLRPIQNFWSWSVRVVYGFLLVIVIIIAFAIMFRQRLSGSAEVTIQSAIPSIALAMILVPLSYAISGLFIDVITVGTNAVHSFLIGAPGSPGNSLFLNAPDIKAYTIIGTEDDNIEDRGLYPDDERVSWLNARNNLNVAPAFASAAQGIGDATILPLVDGIVQMITQGNSDVSRLSFAWVGDLVQVFVSFVSLWIAVQVLIALVKKYIVLILYPVISPFIFATVAVPGNGTKSVIQYAKVMFAASLAYIVTYAMFLLSIIFTSTYFQDDIPNIETAGFNPPLLGLRNLQLGDNTITNLLLTIIGIGIYFSIPSTLKSIDEALGANQPLPKFITTPIESFRESQRVMFKTAPAIAGRGAKIAATGLKNTAYMPYRGITAARDTYDRIRGINPETDYNSYRNRTRRNLASKLDDYKADLEDAKRETNPALRAVKMAAAEARIASVGLAGDRKGTGVGLQGEMASSAPKFTIDETTIIIPRTEIPSLVSASGLYIYDKATGDITRRPGAAGPAVHPRIAIATGVFKAKVEGSGIQIKPPITLDFAKTKPTRDPNIDVFDDSKIIYDNLKKGAKGALGRTEVEAFGSDLEFKDPTSATGYSGWVGSTVEIVINTGGLQEVPKNDNSFDIPYIVYSTNVVDLFGTELNPSTNAPISAGAKLRSGYDVRTKKVSVRINNDDGLTTRAFRVNLKIG